MISTDISPILLLLVTAGYFLLLFYISHQTSKNSSSNSDFFLASKQSHWAVVAYGMIGASLSGVTFISIPGWVYDTQFSYFQMVLGYIFGYIVIMYILLPLYYKRNLISIYGYLNQRFGRHSHKTGALFFILSRVVGSAFRLYLVAMVLYEFIFWYYGVPFWVAVLFSLILIWSYTVKAGIKTILWTDLLQTTFMLVTVVLVIATIASQLNLSPQGMIDTVSQSTYSKIFNFDLGWSDPNNFFKQFLGGMFIAIVMTGLDQDMMQKNLSCKTLKQSQKNMKWFVFILVIVNMMFLLMGALLYIYAQSKGIELPTNLESGKVITDKVFPMIALEHLPLIVSLAFLLGLLAAAYSSADSALTSLTTSFCVDILEEVNTDKMKRVQIHVFFTCLIFFTILIYRYFMDSSAIEALFRLAGYTYGPILGMFAFGLMSHRKVKDKMVPFLAVLAPVLTYFINLNSKQWFNNYSFGFELLLVNALLMFIGMLVFSKSKKANE